MAVDFIIETIQVKRANASAWTTQNPTLLDGEIGFERDTGSLKIGTGALAWNDLDYSGGNVTNVLTDLNDVSVATPTLNHFIIGNGTTFASRTALLADIFDYSASKLEADLTALFGHNRWIIPEVPAGGSVGQVLKKNSGNNYDYTWGNPTTFGGDSGDIPHVPAGNIVATDVEGAIAELDAEKAPVSHTHVEADITDLQSYLLPADIGVTVQAYAAALDAVTGTNTGDQTSIVGITGTKAQFDTAVTDGNFMYIGDAPTTHTHVEADITDLQAYLTTEANDLTAAVVWANVPDANITQSSVTQHQAALSITESQISDLDHSVDFVSNVATSTILGRVTAGSGNSEELTAVQVRTLINVSNGATHSLGPDGDKGDITVGGSGTTLQINSGAIVGSNIANGTITSTQLATGAIDTASLTDNAVTLSKMDKDTAITGKDGFFLAVDETNDQLTFINPTAISITESQISDFGTYLEAADVASGTSTGTTISLTNNKGIYYNMSSANTATSYTTSGTTTGAFAVVRINAASQPTVTGGTLLPGATFATSTDMHMVVQYFGTSVQYYFLALS